MFSIMESNKQGTPITFHILTDVKGLFTPFAKEFSDSANFKFTDPTPYFVDWKFPDKVNLWYFAIILIPQLAETKYPIQIDPDFLCQKDFSELKNLDLEDAFVAGVVDANILKMKAKYWPEEFHWGRENPNADYFNAGLLIINKTRWIELNVFNKTKSLSKVSHKTKFFDQTILNEISQGKVLWLSYEWNIFAQHINNYKLEEECNIHYITVDKPWRNMNNVHAAFSAWLKSSKQM